jgi:Heavy metal associated domain 2
MIEPKSVKSNQINPITKSGQPQKAPGKKISYSVAHAIPGRVRFRIPRLFKDTEYAKKLKLAIESQTKQTTVRINPTASSLVVHYSTELMSDAQMRSHLVNLIQTAPNIVLPKKVSTKTIVGTMFDALINLFDSLRNVNKAHTAIKHQQIKKNSWERLLSSGESIIKGLKSAIMFILPNQKLQSQSALKSA